jgi:hypothetical protein
MAQGQVLDNRQDWAVGYADIGCEHAWSRIIVLAMT